METDRATTQTIGFASAQIEHRGEAQGMSAHHFVHLGSVAVLPSLRKKGVATLLMARVEQWARECGAATVELNVYAGNSDAEKLYADLGYKTLSKKMQYRL